jgi:hypothetical protein
VPTKVSSRDILLLGFDIIGSSKSGCPDECKGAIDDSHHLSLLSSALHRSYF